MALQALVSAAVCRSCWPSRRSGSRCWRTSSWRRDARASARRSSRRTLAEVRRIESSGMLPEEQVRQLEALVSGTERLMLLRVAMALPERSPATEIFARSATTCHDLAWFVEQASAWRGPRANWRRIAALRLLAYQGYSGIVPLLGPRGERPRLRSRRRRRRDPRPHPGHEGGGNPGRRDQEPAVSRPPGSPPTSISFRSRSRTCSGRCCIIPMPSSGTGA